jgi:hypothetical protein
LPDKAQNTFKNFSQSKEYQNVECELSRHRKMFHHSARKSFQDPGFMLGVYLMAMAMTDSVFRIRYQMEGE